MMERDYGASTSHLARLERNVQEKIYSPSLLPACIQVRCRHFCLPSFPSPIPCSAPSLSPPNRPCSPAKLIPRAPDRCFARQIKEFKPQILPNRHLSQTLDTTPVGRRRRLFVCEMSQKSKRTSAPSPMEIPPPIV